MSENTKRGLGRGLGALFGVDPEMLDSGDGEALISDGGRPDSERIAQIKLVDIEPNKGQPRKNFEPEKLEQLAASIREYGVIQPLVVSPTGSGTYSIVAGERRFRAAKLAGVKTVPCLVKDYEPPEALEIALIENLQREDLNPVEEAEGYRALMAGFGLTQEQVSEKVGKSRSAVANSLRLCNLPEEIKIMLIVGELSSGHARAILGLPEAEPQKELAARIIKEGLNVRQVEAMISAMNRPAARKKLRSGIDRALEKYYREVEKQLSGRFGAKVKIIPGAKKSKIELEYYSREDLDRILEIIS